MITDASYVPPAPTLEERIAVLERTPPATGATLAERVAALEAAAPQMRDWTEIEKRFSLLPKLEPGDAWRKDIAGIDNYALRSIKDSNVILAELRNPSETPVECLSTARATVLDLVADLREAGELIEALRQDSIRYERLLSEAASSLRTRDDQIASLQASLDEQPAYVVVVEDEKSDDE